MILCTINHELGNEFKNSSIKSLTSDLEMNQYDPHDDFGFGLPWFSRKIPHSSKILTFLALEAFEIKF